MASYNHQTIEKKWQKKWEEEGPRPHTGDSPTYHLAMFPYPSGAGLHVGHVESYAALDIVTRKARMEGKDVMFPIGFDSFGLPAENYAIKTGVHPTKTTAQAIENFRGQMKRVGLSFDWDREVITSDPEYYKWTQWLFLELLKNDLAYRSSSPVNWCPGCNTVLANEQVVNGVCERCHSEVIQKELEQWFFRITKYADRLLDGLDSINWPENIKAMQRNWIGRSEGVEIEFVGIGSEEQEFSIPVFTTRPDTLFGVSYIVLAPEHPLVDKLTAPEFDVDVVAYRDQARKKSELERTQLEKDKDGIYIGAKARHPITGEEVPIWISDYVLMSYGTGAVMGVPAHDERDFVFATKYDHPIKQVIAAPTQDEAIATMEGAYTGPGILVNSGPFDGLTNEDAKPKIADQLESDGRGQRQVQFRLRDWLVSRQRYWGAPIPVVWCEDCGAVPVEESSLPVELPTDVDFKPTGESPLKGSKTFHNVVCPKCGADARREADTMDTFVDSSWYYLRYCDPRNSQEFASKENIEKWCPVDMYVGGAEHAVLHLLYSRFIAYALHDLGYINFEEPFQALRNQGMILGPDGEKMSKSRGNVVNPDEIVEQYGADTIRLYEMFMGPFEDAKPWDIKAIVGVRRFLDKVWNVRERISSLPLPKGETEGVSTETEGVPSAVENVQRLLHKTIKKVSEDTDGFKFNTAISQMMILVNAMQSAEMVSREDYSKFLLVLAPYAPHLCSELWEEVGNNGSVLDHDWPEFDANLIKDDIVELAVQVNGKLRGTIEIAVDLSKKDARERAEAEENVAKHLDGKEIVKVIYVPGRMINFVAK